MHTGVRAVLAGCWALAIVPAGAAGCSAESTALSPVVVELYTSEGCNSCPPADRWLSSLTGRPGVLALAFHVDYWDRLGWVDRFASPAHTARQRELQATSGAAFVYTPQVVVDGRDWNWRSRQPLPAQRPANVEVTLAQTGREVEAVVEPQEGAPAQLAAYWVVLEDGHLTRVQAGENAGATLRHDHVVTSYRPVSAWSTANGAHRFVFDLPVAREPARPRRVALVVYDARTARPLQAVQIACSAR
jgi:hypothetical protein